VYPHQFIGDTDYQPQCIGDRVKARFIFTEDRQRLDVRLHNTAFKIMRVRLVTLDQRTVQNQDTLPDDLFDRVWDVGRGQLLLKMVAGFTRRLSAQ
jgi:hypothetical protein